MPPGAAARGPADSPDRLGAGLADLGISPSGDDLARLDAFIEMLMRWNAAHGLTARASRQQLVARHILDSAAALPFLPPGPMLDAGSGGGLPGVVLALLRPETDWVLLDSSARKTAFLGHARMELGLSNVQVVRSRLESYQPQDAPAAVIARALAPLPKLVALARRLLDRGSWLLAMLGRRPRNEELAALDGVHCQSLEPIRVPGLDAQRHIAVLRRRAAGQGPARRIWKAQA